jgi:hypothetical protein
MGSPFSLNGLLVGLDGCYPRAKPQRNWAFLDELPAVAPGNGFQGHVAATIETVI